MTEQEGWAVSKCTFCGEEMPKYKEGVNGKLYKSQYCSEKCRRNMQRDKNSDKLTDREKDVSNPRAIMINFWGRKCAICHWQGVKGQYSYGNEIHHIVPVREGGRNSVSNLILLCPNHHMMADRGTLTRDELQTFVESVVAPSERVRPALQLDINEYLSKYGANEASLSRSYEMKDISAYSDNDDYSTKPSLELEMTLSYGKKYSQEVFSLERDIAKHDARAFAPTPAENEARRHMKLRIKEADARYKEHIEKMRLLGVTGEI